MTDIEKRNSDGVAKPTTVKVSVIFIQDRSGSMQSVWEETLSGFKAFVNRLQQEGPRDGIEYTFSLTAFDTLLDHPYREHQILEVNAQQLENFPPRGSTALYDAVGETISKVNSKADKFMAVIVTDGHENSSREWTKDKVRKLIEDKLALGNWAFLYLGTQPETWDDAEAMGVGRSSSASYTRTRAREAYRTSADAVHSHSRAARTGSRDFVADYMKSDDLHNSGMTADPESGVPEPKAMENKEPKGQMGAQ